MNFNGLEDIPMVVVLIWYGYIIALSFYQQITAHRMTDICNSDSTTCISAGKLQKEGTMTSILLVCRTLGFSGLAWARHLTLLSPPR